MNLNSPANNLSRRIFFALVITVLLLLALQKVHDPDVWLHLGLGKYIVEHRELPRGDVFTYTSYGKPYEYYEWLFQAGLYLLYKFFSYNGLMVFKLVLWLLTLGLLWQWMKDEGVESRWAAAFTLFPAYWLAMRWRERPEVVGYCLLALYLLALSRYRRGRNYFYFLPWLQIIWINIHASALLGVVVYLVILLGEGADYFWRPDGTDGRDLRVIRGLAVMVPVLLAVSFINPYGYKLVAHPFLYSREMAQNKIIDEWLSLRYAGGLQYLYWAFLIPGALSFIPALKSPRKNLKITDLLLFVFAALLPYISVRYTTVFAVVALPVAGKNIYQLVSRCEIGQALKTKGGNKISLLSWGGPIMVLILGGMLWGYSVNKSLWGWGPEKYAVPKEALAFIQKNRLPGHIFNWYDWGGYVILEAYPRYLAHTDSRIFDMRAFQEYNTIELTHPGWDKILEFRGVNLVLTRSMYKEGGALIPLVPELLENPQWVLIWSGDATLVFLRNSPQNQHRVQRFALPKAQGYEEIITEGRYAIETFGPRLRTYKSLGWAYMKQGNAAAARQAFIKYLSLNPHDQEAQGYLDSLNSSGN